MKHVRFLEGAEEQGSVSTRCGNDDIVDMSNRLPLVHAQEPAARLRYGRR